MAQRLIALSFSAHGAQIMASNPVVMQFMGREAGVMVLMKLMQLAGPQGGGARGEISYSDIGKRVGVSRTQVGKLLQEAERGGLVRLTREGGRFVELMPSLVQSFDRFVADSMSGHDLLYQLALRQA